MRLGRASKRPRRFLGGICVDGDSARIVVSAAPEDAEPFRLYADRETPAASLVATAGEIARELSRDDGAARVEWCVALAGDGVLHDVVEVPPQVRAFPDARLDACLAGTNWGNVDAVEASGCRLGHRFDGTRCVVGVAHASALDRAAELPLEATRVTSAAAALADLARAVNPEAFSEGSPPAIALLCAATHAAAAVVSGGRVRLLYQTGLLEHFRDVESAAAPVAADDEPLEFELAGAYSMPARARERVLREPFVAAGVDSGVYQATAMRVLQETLDLYREQEGAGSLLPEAIYLTGEAVTHHALRAFLTRFLGPQFAVDELDAALVVRIDDPSRARDFAAAQNLYGGALAALAAAASGEALTFSLDEPPPVPAARRGRRRAAPRPRAIAISRRLTAGLLAALAVAASAVGARLAWTAHARSELERHLRVERDRGERLRAVAEERRAAEAKLEHTRALLGALTSMRARQSLPPDLLSIVEASLPAGTQLDELALAGGSVRISGSAEDREHPTRFALALSDRRDSFADVTPRTETRSVAVYDEEAGGTVLRPVYTFAITARYVRNVASDEEARMVGSAREPESAALRPAASEVPR